METMQERQRYMPPKAASLGTIRPTDLALALGCGLLALVVYLRTLAVSIAWGDSPELTTAAFQAGVPHPTGYPLYMLLGHALTAHLPWGSVAQRMNLLSAFSGSIAVGLTYVLAQRLVRSRAIAAVTALLFAFSLTFWSQAVIAEVYAFHIVLNVAVLTCVVQWDRSGSPRWLAAAAVTYGFCFTHHLMSVLLAPALLYFALTSRCRVQLLRSLPWALPLFLAPLLTYAYLPLAALRDPAANWGDPRTPASFLLHVTGGIYRGKMFHQPLSELWKNVVQYAGAPHGGNTGLLLTQWGAGLVPLAFLGAVSLFRLRRRYFGLTASIYLTVVLYALNYNIADIEVYYIPAHLITALWIGCGIRQIAGWLPRLWKRLETPPAARKRMSGFLSAMLMVLPAMALAANWHVNDLHADRSAISYAHSMLDALPRNAVALASGDREYFPLIYAHYVEKRRPDVTLLSHGALTIGQYLRLTTRMRREGLIVNVPPGYFPLGAKKADDIGLARRIIADNLPNRPVVLIGKDSGLDRQVQGYGYIPDRGTNLPMRVFSTRPIGWDNRPDAPSHPAVVQFTGTGDDSIQLRGWDALPHWRGDVLWLRLSLYWGVPKPQRASGLRVWALFADETGTYDRLDNDEPAMANIHDLGQGAQYSSPPPPQFRETFEVAVPASQYGRVPHLWLSVARDQKFLTPTGHQGRQVDLGALPPLR